MKCPICGCKMKYGKCPYCNITSEQVQNASNKKVSKARKEGRKHEIYYSATLPSDVNKMRLILLTIFLGWAGVNSFYVKRHIKGLFPILSLSFALMFFAINQMSSQELGVVFRFFYELFIYASAISMIMWIFDIVSIITKSYKVPVVLGEAESISNCDSKSKQKVVDSIEQKVLDEVEADRKNSSQKKKK